MEETSMFVMTTRVYKALQKTPEGKLISLRAQSGDGRLDYEEGAITYAPESSMGIFVDETPIGAQRNGISNSFYAHGAGGIVVVYEALPLGKQLPNTGRFPTEQTRYPAVLLGKEVWTETLKKPVWKDITEQLTIKLEKRPAFFGFCIRAFDGDKLVMTLGHRVVQDGNYERNGYKIEFADDGGGNGGFKVFKREA